MAEDAPKSPSLGPAQANIHAVDGSTDQPSNATTALTSDTTSKPAQDGEGDLIMASLTAPGAAMVEPTSSPSETRTAPATIGPVPLDSPLRTTPIHPSLPSVKIPDKALTSAANTNPITLQPFTEAELIKYGFEKLRAQIFRAAAEKNASHHRPAANAGGGGLNEAEKEEISRIREETAALLKQKLDDREAKVREIEREMEEKEKIREVERKVFRKKLAGGKEV